MGTVTLKPRDDHDVYTFDAEKDSSLAQGLTVAILLGGIGTLAYLYNSFSNDKDMGKGRIYNNQIRNFAMAIQDLQDLPPFERQEMINKDPYFQRMYLPNNTARELADYISYKQYDNPELNNFRSEPIPPAGVERTELIHALPYNIITDNIMYEDGNRQIAEDGNVTYIRHQAGRRGTGGNTIVYSTEPAPGLNEKIRRDNPVVVTSMPQNPAVKRLQRLKPLEKTTKRRFNSDYDEFGRPFQPEKAVYDTEDYLNGLSFSHRYTEGEQMSRMSNDTRKVYEDFVTKGKLREGYEIIPSED